MKRNALALTPKQARFALEYLLDLNATQAAIRAGYSARSAEVAGCRLLSNAKIRSAVTEAMKARAERTQVTVDAVLTRLWGTATADPNALIEFRRRCCRHCYGANGDYQFTDREMDRRRAEWALRKAPKPDDVFDELGGIGYDARRDPSPDCQECFGDGVGIAFPKDTRTLSPSAQLLYAGVKQTKDGLEVKLHDQQAALVNVGKHLGMFAERHELTGKDGGPIQIQMWKFGDKTVTF